MKSKVTAQKIIDLIKSRNGIETKKICSELQITPSQFANAKPFIVSFCYREIKKWRFIALNGAIDEVPSRVRKNSVATIIFKMMPASQMGLKERLGMHRNSVCRALNLLKDHAMIYITGWESNKVAIFPIYAAGRGIDMPKPDSKELAKKRTEKYRNKNAELVLESQKTYRKKNREMLRAKSLLRYKAQSETINTIARIKRAMPKIMAKKPLIATQWRTELPKSHQMTQGRLFISFTPRHRL